MHNSALDTAVFYRNLHESGTIPDYEAILEKSYRRLIKKGDTVIDIGAHGGRHTAPFAELVGEKGRVVAFEPLPEKAAILRSRFSQLGQVSVREVALGDKSGQFEYNRVENAPEESGLKQRESTIFPIRRSRRSLFPSQRWIRSAAHSTGSISSRSMWKAAKSIA